MRFYSDSVIMDGGLNYKVDVYLPAALLDVDISDEVWQKAIDDFNVQLNKRPTVTTTVNGVEIDIIRLDSVKESSNWIKIGAVVLLFVIREKDADKIKDIHFCLKGHLTFDSVSGKVDGMVIKNITYGGDNSKKYQLINDSV
jgi:hypothetical protein